MAVLNDAQARVRSPRELFDPEVFDRLVEHIADYHMVTRSYAELVVEQTGVYLKAVADNPGVRVGMSTIVDQGWHAFIMHTQEYTDFCQQTAGRYLHHHPPRPGEHLPQEDVERTIPLLEATGYPVRPEFWEGYYGCCPPGGDCASVIQPPPSPA